MNRRFFVTGTDTGIGKTMIATALAAAWTRRGLDVGVYKPAETGCQRVDGDWIGDDCRKLSAAAGSRQKPGDVASYLFGLPAAPSIAAAAENRNLDFDHLVNAFDAHTHACDVVIAEGAGGLLVPLTEKKSYLDFAKAIEGEVIVVIGSKLGCINHALLTLDRLEHESVSVAGYVINSIDASANGADATEQHRSAIAARTHYPELGAFPWVADDEREDYPHLARLAEIRLKTLLDRVTAF